MHTNDGTDDGLTPLPGNVHAIANEYERLSQLAGGLEELGLFVRTARADGWTGAASDLSLDGRHRIAATCLRAAGAHASAASALCDYHDMLSVLQPMATSLIADARSSPLPGIADAARASLDRFRAQLAETGRVAAARMKQAADDLGSLQAALPDLPVLPAFAVPPLVLPAAAPVRATAPVPPGRHSLDSHRSRRSALSEAHFPNPFRLGDPTQARRVVDLNNRLLLAVRTLTHVGQ